MRINLHSGLANVYNFIDTISSDGLKKKKSVAYELIIYGSYLK